MKKKIILILNPMRPQGEEGKWKIEEKDTADDAIEAFEKMFRVKTRNDWEDKDDFKTFPSRYAVFEES